MNKYTVSFTANIYLNAAAELGYKVEVIEPYFGFALITAPNGKTMRLIANVPEVNTKIPNNITKNKYLTNLLLKEVSDLVPVCKLFVIKDAESSIKEAAAYAAEKDYKVVFKPVKLSLGEGVHVLPQDGEEIARIVFSYSRDLKLNDFMVEDWFQSNAEYRIIAVKGEIVDICERMPAFVTGDGSTDIGKLIADKNTWRREQGFHEIAGGEEMLKMLEQAGLSLSAVPEKGRIVKLTRLCNLSQGGETKRVASGNIAPQYNEIVKKVMDRIGLEMCGIDLMTKDIKAVPDHSKALINEINSCPTPDVSYFADLAEGKPFFGVKKILERLFSGA
jgi:cyanophycin synthetase